MASDDESARTVVVALLTNLGIVVAKLAAAIVTGATAMFAETVHSAADTANSVLLLVAQHRSARPAAKSGLSRGREAYFWALLAAIGVFVVGAVLAAYEGVRSDLLDVHGASFQTRDTPPNDLAPMPLPRALPLPPVRARMPAMRSSCHCPTAPLMAA